VEDLEMIKKCADRMDYKVALDIHGTFFLVTDGTKQPHRFDYNPLTDDAQAMALVKKYGIHIFRDENLDWSAKITDRKTQRLVAAAFRYPDLNRAIVECVSKLP